MTDKDLLAKSEQVEQEALGALDRRRSDRRGVGKKVPCPTCGIWESSVLNYTDSRQDEVYRRRRQCCRCSAVFETEESISRIITPGQIPA